jgi:pimeloyl-ACP methyl ester carboxylesterase
MVAVAKAGYRAIAPDWRGYGLSDAPQDPENAAWEHLISDMLGILDAFSIPKVYKIIDQFFFSS